MKKINEKLRNELKVLSKGLDQSLEKAKMKAKTSKEMHSDASIRGTIYIYILLDRDKEIERAQKQVRNYQKEIAQLKGKLESKTGYEK